MKRSGESPDQSIKMIEINLLEGIISKAPARDSKEFVACLIRDLNASRLYGCRTSEPDIPSSEFVICMEPGSCGAAVKPEGFDNNNYCRRAIAVCQSRIRREDTFRGHEKQWK